MRSVRCATLPWAILTVRKTIEYISIIINVNTKLKECKSCDVNSSSFSSSNLNKSIILKPINVMGNSRGVFSLSPDSITSYAFDLKTVHVRIPEQHKKYRTDSQCTEIINSLILINSVEETSAKGYKP